MGRKKKIGCPPEERTDTRIIGISNKEMADALSKTSAIIAVESLYSAVIPNWRNVLYVAEKPEVTAKTWTEIDDGFRARYGEDGQKTWREFGFSICNDNTPGLFRARVFMHEIIYDHHPTGTYVPMERTIDDANGITWGA